MILLIALIASLLVARCTVCLRIPTKFLVTFFSSLSSTLFALLRSLSLSLTLLYIFSSLFIYVYSLIRVMFGKIFLLTRHLIIVSQETRSRLNLIVVQMPKSI